MDNRSGSGPLDTTCEKENTNNGTKILITYNADNFLTIGENLIELKYLKFSDPDFPKTDMASNN